MLILVLITPYIRILDFDWLIAGVFFVEMFRQCAIFCFSIRFVKCVLFFFAFHFIEQRNETQQIQIA